MHQNVPLSIGRKRVFDSVFPPAPLSDISPTPVATPLLGFSGVGESFGGHHDSRNPYQPSSSDSENVPEQVTWDRAWHNATAFLSLPDESFRPGQDIGNDDELDEERLLKQWTREPPSREILESVFYVEDPSSRGKVLRAGSKGQDLKEWYINETRRHFLTNFRDPLVNELKMRNRPGALQRLVRYLQLVQKIYFVPFWNYVLPLSDAAARDEACIRLRRSLHAITTYSLPSADISYLLAEELATEGLVILGIHSQDEGRGSEMRVHTTINEAVDDDGMELDQKYSMSYKIWRNEPSADRRIQMMTEGEDSQVAEARDRLLRVLEGLQDVGLGGAKAQKIFAEVMNDMMTEFVTVSYAGRWESPSSVIQHLRQWIENVFARLVVEVLHILKTSDVETLSEDHLDVTLSDVERWQEMGIARLGALRIEELFNVIVDWDSSSGAIEDLKHYTTSPATRFYLTSSFTTVLTQRLLQPGASTIEILQLYISIIHAFNQLDPKGVLLDRIARPIRRYLRDRDDTVEVIVGGLLADAVDSDGQPVTSSSDTLVELAVELSKAHELALRENAGELDWDDMNWVPDPIDAAPDYKKSKNSDVIGSLISLFDTKEAFVKELQKVLGDRLLKKAMDYEQEISVLELLKLRFGDSALQACEVMLRDILDSKRVDSAIRSDQKLGAKQDSLRLAVVPERNAAKTTLPGDVPELHAKILSRLFWPPLQDQSFKVPDEIANLQGRYSAGFEALKQCRKLTWLNALGQVTVELDLEDRVFRAEVTTWQATVIYAFQPTSTSAPSSSSSPPVTRTVSDLAHQLDMSPFLVRSACLFWLSKRILIETQRDTFRVLEVLPDDEGEGDSPATHTPGGGNATNAVTKTPSGVDSTGPSDPTSIAAAAAVAAEAAAAKESADAAAMAKMDLYWQFIVGMLTNQGAMPLPRIIMMLKMVVPGGFPFSNEELREFLGQMVVKGKLEIMSGGNYKIVKA